MVLATREGAAKAFFDDVRGVFVHKGRKQTPRVATSRAVGLAAAYSDVGFDCPSNVGLLLERRRACRYSGGQVCRCQLVVVDCQTRIARVSFGQVDSRV